jgi:hypothetical protein
MNTATVAMLLKIAKPAGKAALEMYRQHLNRKYKRVLRKKMELQMKQLQVRRLMESCSKEEDPNE